MVFASFYESKEYYDAPSIEIDTAIATYLTMFHQHDASQRISAHRGARYIQESDSEHEDEFALAKDGTERLRAESPIGQGPSKKSDSSGARF